MMDYFPFAMVVCVEGRALDCFETRETHCYSRGRDGWNTREWKRRSRGTRKRAR